MAGNPRANARAPKTGPAQIAAAERRARALELRKSGATYQQIASVLDVNVRRVGKDIKGALDALVREPAEQVRDLEVIRLDALLTGLWAAARSGNLQAVDRALKIMDRRAKLLGLDHQPGMDRDSSDLDEFLRHMSGGTINIP